MQDDVTPVNHSFLSGAGSTAVGAAGGGVKTGLKAYGITVGICALVGALAFSGFIGTLGLGWALTGAILGGATGAFAIGPAIGVLGGLFGAAKGGVHASRRVSEERGAAQMLDAQLQAAQMQMAAQQGAPIMINAPSNDNRYNFPPQGSAMNPAQASIALNSVQNDGPIAGQQLARV